ncbi:MAG: Glucokinase [Thermodesulfobacteria bacterium]|nr:glucokinase [Thermodesulfobacteriota bacterium]MCU4138036.1 Glucokinase [Thermodesulfobacteriota bacterium]
MILIADIGGTKSRLTLVRKSSKKFFELKIYKSKNFKNIYDVVKKYFLDISLKKRPNIAVFSVAGPVIGNKAHLTNLEWKVSKYKLKKIFGFEKVILINDLQALSASILSLKKSEIFNIKSAKSSKKEPKAFIAPGTGLGEAILVKENPLIILPTEGGHIFFSPLDEEEFNYLKFLEKKGEELSWEKALSGKALSYWYEYYFNESLDPEKITALAKDKNPKALKVIKKFFELLGRKISQLAFYSLPEGGIYIAGGVIYALKEFLEIQEFKEAILKGYFENKKLEKLLEKFSINIIVHPNPCLLGALSILHNQ